MARSNVGFRGTGTLNIKQGGRVESVDGVLARLPGSIGTVALTGDGSAWFVQDALYVGGRPASLAPAAEGTAGPGGTATLSVGTGAYVTAGNTIEIFAHGTIDVSSGGSITVGAGDPEAGPGTLHVYTGGSLLGSGSVEGNVINQGTVAPGSSPGILTIDGNYSQSSGAALVIEIAGTTPGDEFDVLNITGDASLAAGSTLLVQFIDDFVAQSGDTFEFLTVGGELTGAFSTVTLPSLGGGLTWNVSQLYANGALSVSLVGDYNNNGTVDAADYTVWRDTLGSTTNLTADGNGNTAIDAGDYGVWKQNFGRSSGAGSAAAVPEPASLAMALTGLAAAVAAPFRKRHCPLCRATVAAMTMWVLDAVAQVAAGQPIPINDLGTGLYLGQFQGGLYPDGSNAMPAAHFVEGLERSQYIQPLDVDGNPDPDGKYILLSVGMSNTTAEFCKRDLGGSCDPDSFMGQAELDLHVEQTSLVMIDGAAGGQGAQRWDSPLETNYDRVRDDILAPQGLSEAQVQSVWLKQANLDSPSRPLLPSDEADAYEFLTNLGEITRALGVRYPNLQQVFVSSRIFGGYARPTSNSPEPYAYESGFSVKWLVEAQIEQMDGAVVDPRAGDLNYDTVAPWLAWGPYMWADGTVPRSDGLVWPREDFAPDGIHPSDSGQQKVGGMLLDFFKTSPHTRSWFLTALPGDYNGDGVVDAADYSAWRDVLGGSFTPAGYDVWKQNFGRTSGAGSSAAVPEPASLALALSVLAAVSAAVVRMRFSSAQGLV